MRWFRFHSEALDDPKVQRLAPNLFKTWVNLLCIAAQAGGRLPSVDDIAFRLRLSASEAEQQLSDLILAGLIDIGPDGGRSPHNWASRQYASDDSKSRVRKHREKKKRDAQQPDNTNETPNETGCNGYVTDDETPPEQNQSQNQIQNISSSPTPRDRPETRRAGAREHRFGLGFAKGGRREGDLESVRLHAERFGLPFEEFLASAKRANADNSAAYVLTACANRIKALAPRLPSYVIREALKGDAAGFTAVSLALLAAEGAQ